MKRKMLCVNEHTHKQVKTIAKKKRRKVYDMVQIIVDFFIKQKDK